MMENLDRARKACAGEYKAGYAAGAADRLLAFTSVYASCHCGAYGLGYRDGNDGRPYRNPYEATP